MQKTAVFDLDGTLVDTAPDLAASLNHCLHAVGITELELAVVRPHAGHGARRMLTEAYRLAERDLPPTEMELQFERFLAHYAENIAVHSRPFPGAVDAMDRFSEAGWLLAICTNKTESLAVSLLQALSLDHRFAAICGADTFPRRKPDPLHLTETIARVGGSPDRSVMIGDTATDVDTARAAGIPSVLVDFGYGADAKTRAGASIVVSHYDELTPALADRLLEQQATV